MTATATVTSPPALAPQLWKADEQNFASTLLEIRYPPKQLWTIGDRSVIEVPCVAIVGTRRMTAYGERTTRRLAAAFANAGACVVSGMAQGVDATAHRAAIEAGGKTAAVLGTGVDVPYPAGHRRLHAEIARAGCLISEMEPGRGASPGCFPRRNRLIAGLASVTIVVEAPDKSGALLTAAEADQAHRIVAAVPGPIDSPQSGGTNRLLRDGAQVIASVNDALTLMGLTPEPEQTPTLRPTEQKIWDALKELEGAPVELISARCGIELRETLAAITALEIAGLVAYDLSGAIRRR